MCDVQAALGEGLVGSYSQEGGRWRYEGPRPGPGWHRHDWQPRRLVLARRTGVETRVVHRRRWRLTGTTQTRLDRCPDELGLLHATVLTVLYYLWAWLASGRGLEGFDEPFSRLEPPVSRRTVQRWRAQLRPAAMRLQQALRTTVLERHEPRPIEKLFPGGLSPPGCVWGRWWKGPDGTYSLATALSFLFAGSVALKISATVLLAEARRRLDGPLGSTGF